MSQRIYKVESKTGKKWLVQGSSQGQALKKITDGLFTVRAATAQDVFDGMNEKWEMIKEGETENEQSNDSTGA